MPVQTLNRNIAPTAAVPSRWVSGEYFKAMEPAKFAEMAKPFAGDLPDYLAAHWDSLAELLRTRIERLGQIPDEIGFLCEQPAFDAELYVNKRNKVTPEKAKDLLPAVIELLEAVPESEWTNDSLYAKLEAHRASQAAGAEPQRLGSEHHVLAHEAGVDRRLAVGCGHTDNVGRVAKHVLEMGVGFVFGAGLGVGSGFGVGFGGTLCAAVAGLASSANSSRDSSPTLG